MSLAATEAIRRSSSKKNTFFKLDLAVLACLNRQDCYGYEITTIIKEQTKQLFNLREGVLYPILYKLSSDGMISSENRIVNGRNRIYYHLEEKGKQYMYEMYRDYLEGQSVINNYLIWTGCASGKNAEELRKIDSLVHTLIEEEEARLQTSKPEPSGKPDSSGQSEQSDKSELSGKPE